MEFSDPKVIVGGALVGGIVLYYAFRGTSSSAAEDDGFAPSLISYVSPGDKDATISGTASTYDSNDGTASAITTASAYSDDTTLSALNTDSLLANVSSLVNSQVSKLPFKTDFGFSSNVTGAITLDKAGAPAFSFTSSFTPKADTALGAKNKSLTKQATGWRARYDALLAKTKPKPKAAPAKPKTTVKP